MYVMTFNLTHLFYNFRVLNAFSLITRLSTRAEMAHFAI